MRFGTPGYAAPEQSGDMELGVYTDVYQIGALLFWLLTGETMERGDIRKVPGKLGRILRTCTREKQGKALWVCAFDPGRSKAAGYPDKWAPDRGGNLSYMCVCRNKGQGWE